MVSVGNRFCIVCIAEHHERSLAALVQTRTWQVAMDATVRLILIGRELDPDMQESYRNVFRHWARRQTGLSLSPTQLVSCSESTFEATLRGIEVKPHLIVCSDLDSETFHAGELSMTPIWTYASYMGASMLIARSLEPITQLWAASDGTSRTEPVLRLAREFRNRSKAKLSSLESSAVYRNVLSSIAERVSQLGNEGRAALVMAAVTSGDDALAEWLPSALPCSVMLTPSAEVI